MAGSMKILTYHPHLVYQRDHIFYVSNKVTETDGRYTDIYVDRFCSQTLLQFLQNYMCHLLYICILILYILIKGNRILKIDLKKYKKKWKIKFKVFYNSNANSFMPFFKPVLHCTTCTFSDESHCSYILRHRCFVNNC